jgi:hypothetical protein
MSACGLLIVRVPSIGSLRPLQDDLEYSGSKARQAVLAKPQEQTTPETLRERCGVDNRPNRDGFAQLKQGLPDARAAQPQAINTAATDAW